MNLAVQIPSIETHQLWLAQVHITNEIKAAWAAGRPYLLCGGQRGGKCILAQALSAGFAHVALVSRSASHARDAVEAYNRVRDPALPKVEPWSEGQLRTHLNITNTPGYKGHDKFSPAQVFIIDEIFWMNRGESLVVDLMNTLPSARILAMGSWAGKRWLAEAAIRRFTSFEMNPTLDPESEHMRALEARDPARFRRDFLCRD